MVGDYQQVSKLADRELSAKEFGERRP